MDGRSVRPSSNSPFLSFSLRPKVHCSTSTTVKKETAMMWTNPSLFSQGGSEGGGGEGTKERGEGEFSSVAPKHDDRGYKHKRGHADDDEGGDGDDRGWIRLVNLVKVHVL